MNNRKTLFTSLVIVLLVGLMIAGGTFAYFQWTTDVNQRTNVNVTIEAGGIKMIMTPEGGVLEAKGLKPVADCTESYAYFDTKIQIQNTTGSLVVPSFKLKARVKPNDAANAGALKKSDLAHIHYTVVEIDRIGQVIKDDKTDNTGARRCYEPSHIQKDSVGRDGLFVSSSNDGTVATGTFAAMSEVLDGDGWTSAINLPSDSSKFLARQYNDDPVKGDLGTFGITFMGDIADNTGMRLTNRYFRVYVWIDAGYTYTNAGTNMKDPLNNAIIEVTWSTDSIVQQVTGSVNRAPGLYELNGDYTPWNTLVENYDIGADGDGTVISYVPVEVIGDLIIPEGITYINNYVFTDSLFKSVYIPSSLSELGQIVFADSEIEEIIFAENSQLKVIPNMTFMNTKLKSIVIPSSVTTIGSQAFANTNIESIYIPASVTSIGNSTFENCSNLKTVTYGGTVDEWLEATSGYNWRNDLPNIDITCSDGILPRIPE